MEDPQAEYPTVSPRRAPACCTGRAERSLKGRARLIHTMKPALAEVLQQCARTAPRRSPGVPRADRPGHGEAGPRAASFAREIG